LRVALHQTRKVKEIVSFLILEIARLIFNSMLLLRYLVEIKHRSLQYLLSVFSLCEEHTLSSR